MITRRRDALRDALLAGFVLLLAACDGAGNVGPGDDLCLTETTLSERLEFSSAAAASEILGRADDWALQLSVFDRGARMRTLEPTTTQGLLAFIANAADGWGAADQTYWGGLFDRLSAAMAGLNPDVPEIYMVKTTGREEFNAAYSRNRSIMLPDERVALDGPVAGDERRDFFLLAHEFFHYLSTEDRALRDALYALLGFDRFSGFEYPAELEGRRLSNPGGHSYDHALTVQTEGGMVDVVPVIQSTAPLEEVIQLPTEGPPAIFGVLDIVLLPIDIGTGNVQRDGDGELIEYSFGTTDWPAQMLRNSNYIIHPEELLADNFALLMEWRASGVMPDATPGGFDVNDVGLLTAIEDVLADGCRE